MNFLSVEKLSKSYNEKQLFDEISFGLSQGQKVGLVGINGTGKSTLLKIIAGVETPDSGQVILNNNIQIAYLDQQPSINECDTIFETVFNTGNDEMMRLIRSYEEEISKVEKNLTDSSRLNELIEQMDNANAWDYESKIKQILGKLGIEDFDQQIKFLSGGQRKRVALAAALIRNPDLLIIDEPTNHLDIDMIEWLENYLASQSLTLLLVTHDRYFLEKITNEIIELHKGGLRKYQGNYSYFLEKKLELELQEKQEVEKAKNLMRTELDWMRRQPKARGTKAKYRVDAFYDLKETASKNLNEQQVQLSVKSKRQGKKILEFKNIGHGFGEKMLFQNFDYTFKRGDRIGIIGKNGTGKSTFLNILTGKINPQQGEIEKGESTLFGYYTQEATAFDPGHRVIDTVKEVAEVIQMADGSTVSASQLLGLFLFPPKTQYKLVETLSGGEKRRLQLLRVLIKNPNFLILDEPTNDLDLQTLNILEDFLISFDGCIILVSHDRYFMDKLVDHSFIFGQGTQIEDFPGNYSDFRNRNTESKAEPTPKPAKNDNKVRKNERSEEKRKLSFKEKKEYESLETEIENLEVEKNNLIQEMNGGAKDHDELQNIALRIESIDKEIDEKTERWIYLGDFI